MVARIEQRSILHGGMKMIVGGYTLELYCDFCNRNYFGPDEFINELGSICRKKAKKYGWILKGNKAKCPVCSKKDKNNE